MSKFNIGILKIIILQIQIYINRNRHRGCKYILQCSVSLVIIFRKKYESMKFTKWPNAYSLIFGLCLRKLDKCLKMSWSVSTRLEMRW